MKELLKKIVYDDPGSFIFVRSEKDTIEDVMNELKRFFDDHNIEPMDLILTAIEIKVDFDEDISKFCIDLDQILAVYLLTSKSFVRSLFLIAAYKKGGKKATFKDAFDLILEYLKKVPVSVKLISKYYFENETEVKKK